MTRRAPVIVKLDSWHNVYAREVVFVYGASEVVNRWLVRELDPDAALVGPTKARWILWQRGECFTDYIVVLKRPSPRNAIAALMHEVVHHASDTMKRAGIDTRENDEPLAYYSEWIFRQALHAMRLSG